MPPDEVEPAYWFAIAGEDRGHFEAVDRLTTRVMRERVDWFQRELFAWRGPDEQSTWWRLKEAFELARSQRLPVHGHFDGLPAKEDAPLVRAQLLLWAKAHAAGETLNVVFAARDTDARPRADGARQAVDHRDWPFPVVLAHPHPEVEAWHIVGFVPDDDDERARLAEIRSSLGFDPTLQPHRLSSTSPDSKRDAKAVLHALAADDDRKARCLDAPLDHLRVRGGDCGLTTFLEDVTAKVLPLFKSPPATRA